MSTPQVYSSFVPTQLSADGFTYSNDSCMFQEGIALEDLDPAALMYRRFLLRIPMWIFSACSLYIAIAVTIFVLRKARTEKEKNRNTAVLRNGLLIASWVTTIVLWYFSLAIFVEVNHTIKCSSWYRVENALFWSNISVIYTVLWLRQRVLHRQRFLRRLIPKVASLFSNAIVVMVIVLPISNVVIFSIAMVFCFDEIALICRVSIRTEPLRVLGLMVVELTVPIILPLTLLGLFAWPLIRYHLESKCKLKCVADQRSLIRVLRRICIATAFCLASDIGAMISNVKCDIFVSPTLRHMSLFCNLVCLVFTFAEWRKILFPMLPKTRKVDSKSVTVRSPLSSAHLSHLNYILAKKP